MKMPMIKTLVQSVSKFAVKNAPTIFATVAGIGVIGTAAFAIEGTIKAEEIIQEKNENREEPMTKKEVLKEVWPCYIPMAATAVLSISAIFLSNHINKKRLLMLGSLCAANAQSLKKYQDKVKELLGEKTHQKVTDALDKDDISKVRVEGSNIPGKGSTLCMDSLTGQLRWVDLDKVERVISDLNRQLIAGHWASMNDYLSEIGFRESRIGDELGWSVGDGGIKIRYASALTEDNVPCLLINFDKPPAEIPWQ